MDIDTYSAYPPWEHVPKDEPARSDCVMRIATAAIASLSLLYSRYPDLPREFADWELANARRLFGQRDDKINKMHWTFNNPQNMGS